MPKDRGAEQGDVDGPLECSLALGMVAAEARRRVAAQQAAGSLPCIGVDDSSEEDRLQLGWFRQCGAVTVQQTLGPHLSFLSIQRICISKRPVSTGIALDFFFCQHSVV